MKQGLKIAIIAFVAVALIVIIFLSVKSLGAGSDRVIASTPFEKNVEQRVKDGIDGKDYRSAGAAFISIMDYIDTEAGITLADGAKNIKPEEAKNAKTMVFNAYAPMVVNRANEIFNSSAWNDSELNAISAEAQRLQKSGVGDASIVTQLGQVVNIISDYRAAWGVVNSASKCGSVGEIATLTARAENYNRAPLTNSVSLMNALKSVPDKAKSAVVTSIFNKAVGVYNKAAKCGYSWDSFYAARDNVNSSIQSYASHYGTPAKLDEAAGYLSRAAQKVSDCQYDYYYEEDGYDYF